MIVMKGYTVKEIPENSAIARGVDMNISLKDAVNIAHHLRGKTLNQAKDIVDRGIEKKVPIPYFRYLDSVSHRKSMGPGRYPVRALKAFKQVLQNAESNAEFKSLDLDSLVIGTISASKGTTVKKYLPKAQGRGGASFKELINIEIILREVKQ